MFDPDLVRGLRHRLDAVEKNAKPLTEREQKLVKIGATPDSLRMDGEWYDLWRKLSPGMAEYLKPFNWVIFPPQVRILRQHSHLVPWHQDVAYQKLLGARGHKRLITCFVPMDDEPSKHSTLQFIERELPDELSHTPIEGHGAGLENVPPGPLRHYGLKLGDCLCFGDLAVHRTFVPKGAIVERRSFEFRLIQSSDALDEKDYFDVDLRAFVRTDGSRRNSL